MLSKLYYIIIICLVAMTTTVYAKPSEHIQQFSSTISVNPDASIDVTENITVFADRKKIKRGIVRWLPTKYADSYGITHRTRYHVQQVLMNGQVSKYHTQHDWDKFAIYIGDKNTLLKPGVYTYTIQYHVNNAVNFLSDGDEIYWNITGNRWDFPINQVQAIILLPRAAKIGLFAGYTGVTGGKGQDFTVTQTADNAITFSTTKPLPPGQGLTIAVSWQKGIVQPPDALAMLSEAIQDGVLIAVGLLLILFIYYFLAWRAVGRDPAKGTIIPLFEPPEGLTPEAIRFIMNMSFDNKTYSAAIVNLAAKGVLTIENQGSTFELKRITTFNQALPPEEQSLVRALFGSKTSLIISQSNHEIVKDGLSTLREKLKACYEGKYFHNNRQYLPVGIALTLLAFVAVALFSDNAPTAFFIMIWITIWSIACITFAIMIVNTSKLAWITRSLVKGLYALFLILFFLPFLAGELVGLSMLTMTVGWLNTPILILMILINFMFWDLLKAPTTEGRLLMDKIEGFKLFFKTTEHYRLQLMSAPKKTLTMYETYLPYAIALDLETEWAAQFNDILQQSGVEPNNYHPSWYSGGKPWSSQSVAALPVLIGAGLASSLASASTSSSASGGGGSSGGGGGGGGGGGW